MKEQKKYVNSYYFVDTLSRILNKKDTIVTDMGFSFTSTHQAFKVKGGQTFYTNSGHAPMGWGLPASVGAFYGKKNIKRVICLTGEGGLQMNIQELSTIMHNKIPIKIFIFNNGGYLTIKQTQQLGFGGRIMGADKKSGLSFPNYKKIAESHKFKYFNIKSNKPVVICVFDKNSVVEYVKLQNQLRSAEISVEIYSGDGNLKTQMKYADKLGSPAVIFYGENEIKSRKVTLKNLKSGQEISVEMESLVDEIKKLL